MNQNKLPKKYELLWNEAKPLLEKARPGDLKHCLEVAFFILDYKGSIKFDEDILVPVALMHDIGHCQLLDEHFKYITGPSKVTNGKLVHMLIGAKIAKDILEKINYPKDKTKEIVDIISIHDGDSIKEWDDEVIFNSVNKRFFHDMDRIGALTVSRLESIKKVYKDNEELIQVLTKIKNKLFFEEFKQTADNLLKKIRLELK